LGGGPTPPKPKSPIPNPQSPIENEQTNNKLRFTFFI
jgi:hypothetical protein